MTASIARRSRSWLYAEAFLLAAVARAGVRCFSVPRVARGLGALPRRRRACHDAVEDCLAAAESGAARAAHATCLFRSLVAFGLLARRGHDAAIHLGAIREDGLSAHAWVTIAGDPVEPLGASVYVSLWHHQASFERSGSHSWLPPSGGRTGPPLPPRS